MISVHLFHGKKEINYHQKLEFKPFHLLNIAVLVPMVTSKFNQNNSKDLNDIKSPKTNKIIIHILKKHWY